MCRLFHVARDRAWLKCIPVCDIISSKNLNRVIHRSTRCNKYLIERMIVYE